MAAATGSHWQLYRFVVPRRFEENPARIDVKGQVNACVLAFWSS